MSRNYANEAKWAKEKYFKIQIMIDKEQYKTDYDYIRDNYGIAPFFIKAMELFKANPELFKKED